MLIRNLTAISCTALAVALSAQAQTATGDASSSAQQQNAGSTLTADTCSSGFSVTDTDNDGTITREEFDSWNEAGFGALDSDADGALSRTEFVDCMSAGFADMAMDRDRTPESMAQADADASGEISADEYMSATSEARRQVQAGQSDGLVVLRRYILVPSSVTDDDLGAMSEAEIASGSAKRFRALDADTSGGISEEEWSSTSSIQGEMSDWLNLDFDKMDADGDDAVSRDEFDTYADQRWSAAEEAAMTRGAMESAMQSSGSTGETGTANQPSGTEAGDASGGRVPMIYYYYFGPMSDS